MTNETEIQNETNAGQNDKRMGDLMKQVGALGRDAASGRDSLPKLAHAVVKAASDGVIDPTYKDDKGNDHAALIYSHYAKNDSTKAFHEHSKAGMKANVSKLRQLINFGAMTTVDAVEVMQVAYEQRANAEKNKEKVKSAYPFYIDVARKQLNGDAPLTESDLYDLALKEEAAPKELEGELKRALKILEGLVTGENRDKLKDDNELTEAAFHAVKERLEALALVQKQDELRRKAAALGLKLA